MHELKVSISFYQILYCTYVSESRQVIKTSISISISGPIISNFLIGPEIEMLGARVLY